jgi:hypothetical protein
MPDHHGRQGIMKKVVIALVAVVAAAGLYWMLRGESAAPGAAAATAAGRPTLAVELGTATRGSMSDLVTVVGNLEGQASVDV